jgi:DNA-binding CsgD family transcriptional regulator
MQGERTRRREAAIPRKAGVFRAAAGRLVQWIGAWYYPFLTPNREPEPRAQLFGRDAELELLREFLEGSGRSSALALSGAAGIGKTSLWDAGVVLAQEQERHVVVARPSEVETRLAFSALADLLDGIEVAGLLDVPVPQRQALEAALFRSLAGDEPPGTHAIMLGLLNVLRGLAAERPVFVAIDDVQWLDVPSAEALAFAARRLRDEPIAFLLAMRPGGNSSLEEAFDRGRLARIEVGAMSFGAVRGLLFERLGLTLPRHLLRRVVDLTQGNPLFALELGRLLAEHGLPSAGDDLPLPDAIEDLLDARVNDLSPQARQLLLALALSADSGISALTRIGGADALNETVDSGLVLIEGDQVRPAHPLYAAAARKRSLPAERRELHLRLAEAVDDEELRARHLALATTAPDAGLATAVAAAATHAAARGARHDAVELAEHALRLTPADDAARPERLLALAASLETAGELQRLTELLAPAIEAIPHGSLRARAWLLLAEGAHVDHVDAYKAHLEHALAEARDDPALRARVVAKVSSAVIAVERIHEAEAQALAVLPDAREAGPDVERPVLFALAWARGLRGLPVDDLCDRFARAAATPGFLALSPERIAGQRLVWRGLLGPARAVFERLDALADERGELTTHAWARLHLCELALRAGECEDAARLLDDWAESTESDVFTTAGYERCRALLATVRGSVEEAERWAADAIAAATAIGTDWDRLEGLRAAGTSALLAHRPDAATETLGLVSAHALREGVDEPGVFPVAPELVEALAETNRLDEAREVTSRLHHLATEQKHPWGLATARRCDALIRLASDGNDEAAATQLEAAATEYDELGLQFDRARSLLALGRARRRRRKWADARRSLDEAAAIFTRCGSTGWAHEAHSELARIQARRPRPRGSLTPAEEQVAQLAAAGLANKEIARTLFISVHTVEEHLSRTYAKLGIRSRSQLARRLPA